MADPFDKGLSGIVAKAVSAEGVLQGDGVRLHEKGTVICIGKCSSPSFVFPQYIYRHMWRQVHTLFEKLTAS